MFSTLRAQVSERIGGVFLALMIAAAAQFLSEHYGAPAMLFALLIGMAFHHLAVEPRTATGIAFSSTTLLRLGVAALGLRLSFSDIASLGWPPVIAVIGLTLATFGVGALLACAMAVQLRSVVRLPPLQSPLFYQSVTPRNATFCSRWLGLRPYRRWRWFSIQFSLDNSIFRHFNLAF
jgi:hypothetical protein